jgi:hypothetical protein
VLFTCNSSTSLHTSWIQARAEQKTSTPTASNQPMKRTRLCEAALREHYSINNVLQHRTV